MRILMVVPKYPFPVAGGLERQAHELAKALVGRGHVVEALSSHFDPRQGKDEVVDCVPVHRVPWLDDGPARFLRLPFSLGPALLRQRKRIDIVHVHNISWFGAFVTAAAKGMGLPVVTKLPNIREFGIPGMHAGPLGPLRVKLLKHSDVIVAMTPESLEELASVGFPTSRVLRVANGIALSTVSPVAAERQSQTIAAVFTGRVSAEKGLTDLLHAWALVMARTSIRVVLRLVGEGPQERELRALALALGLGESVEFVGYSSNVSEELARADLFVLPSYAEGNSNAILEAMRAGLPVVTTRIGGAPMQVGREGQCLLVAPGDREALAARLLDVITDPRLRLRIGAAMRDRVERLFAIDRVAAVYERAYEAVLAGHREEVGALNPDLFDPAPSAT